MVGFFNAIDRVADATGIPLDPERLDSTADFRAELGIDGFVEGLSGRASRTPQARMQMVRDPVCGTFLLPDRAVTLDDGSHRVFFCSPACRDTYRARPSTRSGRSGPSTNSGSPRATSSGEHVEGRRA